MNKKISEFEIMSIKQIVFVSVCEREKRFDKNATNSNNLTYRSSRVFYGSGNEYGTRDRCREDFYTLASTPVPLSDVESMGAANAIGGNCIGGNSLVPNVNIVNAPIPNQNSAVLQQSSLPSTLPKQSPSTQANVSSVFYTVQRVITTSQIQTSGAYMSNGLPLNHDCNQSMLQMSQGKIETISIIVSGCCFVTKAKITPISFSISGTYTMNHANFLSDK